MFLIAGTFSGLNHGKFHLLAEAEIPRAIKKTNKEVKQENVSLVKSHLLNTGWPYWKVTEHSVSLRSLCRQVDVATRNTYQEWWIILSKYQMHVSFPLAEMHSETLRVADKVDSIRCVLHYWINSRLESLHLLPHGLQAGTSVKQVDNCHICARMRLQERKEGISR